MSCWTVNILFNVSFNVSLRFNTNFQVKTRHSFGHLILSYHCYKSNFICFHFFGLKLKRLFHTYTNVHNVLVNVEKPFTIQISPNHDSIWVHFSDHINGNIAIGIADTDNKQKKRNQNQNFKVTILFFLGGLDMDPHKKW